MTLDEHDLARLRSQMSRGEIVLFTGAGFSIGAKDSAGRLIPSTQVLKEELWKMCFPQSEFDPSASLGDLYATGLHRLKDLKDLLQTRLSVDSNSLPDYYRVYFDVPWLRCYTLNIDDLECAVANTSHLRRRVKTISATAAHTISSITGISRGDLEVVHLNGFIGDPPEQLTFSENQYAERITSQEPWYSRCAADLMCRPVIFIGTLLNEALLWQHMELRKRRNSQGRDLRPTSILVTPNLTLPRQELLRDFRIEWYEGTAESFAAEVLSRLSDEANRGFSFLGAYAEGRISETLPLISDLSSERPSVHTEYLLGEEPQWSDILNGRAIERAHDQNLLKSATEILE